MRRRIFVTLGGFIAACLCAYYVACLAPASFTPQTLVEVRQGETLREITLNLQATHVVRFARVVEVLVRMTGKGGHIVAGEYYFPHAQNAFGVAERLIRADFGLEPVRIIIPEGTDVRHISLLLAEKVPAFNMAAFLKIAEPQEGYLFPDTYFIYPGETPNTFLHTMKANFDTHIQTATVQTTVKAFPQPFTNVVIMASLLEKEAPDTKNRRIIAGILWKRISLGMPLQVDAVFPYIIGDASKSPYNTYVFKGLPPGPITNPGLDSIVDAASPVETPYLYYLSDHKGIFHYSTTYAEQLANQKKYLP